MRCLRLFFFGATHVHRDLQPHHHNAIKAKTTPMPRPSKRKLAERSNRIKRARISVERELEAQALLQSEEPGPHSESEEPGPHSESEEESDIEVSDSENESDVEFNQ